MRLRWIITRDDNGNEVSRELQYLDDSTPSRWATWQIPEEVDAEDAEDLVFVEN